MSRLSVVAMFSVRAMFNGVEAEGYARALFDDGRRKGWV
jgi:hypothetical protein